MHGGLPISYYQVYGGTSPSSLTKVATVTGTTYTQYHLNAGQTYYYYVVAMDSANDLSVPSTEVSSQP